jgi:hypothetical protein
MASAMLGSTNISDSSENGVRVFGGSLLGRMLAIEYPDCNKQMNRLIEYQLHDSINATSKNLTKTWLVKRATCSAANSKSFKAHCRLSSTTSSSNLQQVAQIILGIFIYKID